MNSAEFAPWRRIMIAADAVLVLPDDGSATRHPYAIARDEFSFLLSIARARHAAQVRIDARAPLRDAGEGLASAEDRLPKSLHFAESDVIIGVVRARSVHEVGYGHKWDWET